MQTHKTHTQYWGIFGTNSVQQYHLSSYWSVVVTENKMFSPIFCQIMYNIFYFSVYIHRVALGLFSCMWKLLCSLLQIAPFESRLLFYWPFIWVFLSAMFIIWFAQIIKCQQENRCCREAQNGGLFCIIVVLRDGPHRCCCSIKSTFLNITVLSAWHLCNLS